MPSYVFVCVLGEEPGCDMEVSRVEDVCMCWGGRRGGKGDVRIDGEAGGLIVVVNVYSWEDELFL